METEFKIEDIKRIHLNKDDVLKVKVNEHAPASICREMHEMLSSIFPNNKILIVNGNVEFEIIDGGSENV